MAASTYVESCFQEMEEHVRIAIDSSTAGQFLKNIKKESLAVLSRVEGQKAGEAGLCI